MDKRTFLTYVEFLSNPLFKDKDTKHYMALHQGPGREHYYDVFLVCSDKKPYITTSLPEHFKGPHDLLLVDNEIDPSDFYDYISPDFRNFDVQMLIAQLREKVVIRGTIHKKAVDFFDEKLPNEDLNKAVLDMDNFAKALGGAVRKMLTEKVRSTLSVIKGGK